MPCCWRPAAAEGSATPRIRPPVADLLGTWNYDQPDRTTGVNLATISCPPLNGAPAYDFAIPQIGR